MPEISHIQVTVPKEIHRTFSVLTKAKDLTMAHVLREAIDAFIKENAHILEMKT